MTSVIYTSTEQFPKKTFLSRWFQSHWYQHNSLPRKIAPQLGLGFRSRLGLALGLALRLGGGWQPGNCLGEILTPG